MVYFDAFTLVFVVAIIELFSFLFTFKINPPQPLFMIIGAIFLFGIFAMMDNIAVDYAVFTNRTQYDANDVNNTHSVKPVLADTGFTTNEGRAVKMVLLFIPIFQVLFGILAQWGYTRGKFRNE